jgi:hypothetical protein
MASKRGMRRRRCNGKRQYETVALAEVDAARLRRAHRTAVDVYRCPNCGGIHVGHRPHVVAPSPALRVLAR